jgi:hypothetical protein
MSGKTIKQRKWQNNTRNQKLELQCVRCGSIINTNQYDKDRHIKRHQSNSWCRKRLKPRDKDTVKDIVRDSAHSNVRNIALSQSYNDDYFNDEQFGSDIQEDYDGDGVNDERSNASLEDCDEYVDDDCSNASEAVDTAEQNFSTGLTLPLCRRVFSFQEKLLKQIFFSDSPIVINRHRKIPEAILKVVELMDHDSVYEGTWRDVLKINAFAVKNNLPDTALLEMVDLFSDIWLERGHHIMLPKSIHGFKDPLKRAMKIYRIMTHNYSLRDFMFGTVDTKGRKLRDVIASSLDIEEQLAKECLLLDPSKVTFEPQEGAFCGFRSGDIFKKLSSQIKTKYRNPEMVPICIQFSFDGTTINSTRSREESPLQWSIMNDLDGKMNHLGFVPIQMPYRDTVLHEILLKNIKVTTNVDRNAIIKNLKREVVHRFLYDVFSPLLKYQNSDGLW